MKINNSKFGKLCYLLLLIFIILSLSYIGLQYLNSRKSITIKEAYHIAYAAVVKKNSQALLVSISSTDSIKKPESRNAGKNGTRRYWNLIFAAPNTDKYWIVGIRDRRIVDLIKVIGSPLDKSDLIDKIDILIDSREALKIAQGEYSLKPGEVWAIGYHFTISKEYGNVLLHVFCRDQSNNFTNISINAKTKKITGAIHKVSIGGGIFDGSSYKGIVSNYDIEGIRMDHNSDLFAWGRKMLNIIQYQPIILYKKGKEDFWNKIDFKYDIMNIEPAEENNIFVISVKKIYLYNLISKRNTSILELDDTILNSRVYHDTLYILTTSDLMLSADYGKTWSKISLPEKKNIMNISCDFDEKQNFYISINNKIYLLVNAEWEQILTCEDHINDFKFAEESILYTTDKAVKVYDLRLRQDDIINDYHIIKKLIPGSRDYFFAIGLDGKLYRIKENNENNDWIIIDCYTNKNNGLITDVIQVDEDKWYYSTVAENKWVKLNKAE